MKINKYYRDAYNNPSQFNIEGFKGKENLTEVQKNVLNGVTDAYKDRQNKVYKFKS
jgi:hypothetical protein